MDADAKDMTHRKLFLPPPPTWNDLNILPKHITPNEQLSLKTVNNFHFNDPWKSNRVIISHLHRHN